MEMPEGIRLGIEVYMLSETLNTGSVVLATGCKELPEDLDKMIQMSLEAANDIMGVTDFRVMNDQEIDGYRQLVQNEKDEAATTMDEVSG